MLSDSISEGVNFQNFLGGHAPRPPYIWHALHASMCASYKMGMHFIICQYDFSPPTFENVPTPLITRDGLLCLYINPLHLCFFDREISGYNRKLAILEYSIVHKQIKKIYRDFSVINIHRYSIWYYY